MGITMSRSGVICAPSGPVMGATASQSASCTPLSRSACAEVRHRSAQLNTVPRRFSSMAASMSAAYMASNDAEISPSAYSSCIARRKAG